MSDQWEAIDVNTRGSLIAVSTVDDKTIVRLTADPITGALLVSVSGGGGGFTELIATGSVNGINTSFTFTQAPTYIISGHAVYRKTNSDGTTNWTGTTSVVMTQPPSEDIFGWK